MDCDYCNRHYPDRDPELERLIAQTSLGPYLHRHTVPHYIIQAVLDRLEHPEDDDPPGASAT